MAKGEAMGMLHTRVKPRHRAMLEKLLRLLIKVDPRGTESDVVRIAIEEKFNRDIK